MGSETFWTLFEQISLCSRAVECEKKRFEEAFDRAIKKIWSTVDFIERLPTGRPDTVIVKSGSASVLEVGKTVKLYGLSGASNASKLVNYGQKIVELVRNESSKKKILEIVNFLKKCYENKVYSVQFKPRKIIFYDGSFLREATVHKVKLTVCMEHFHHILEIYPVAGEIPIRTSIVSAKVDLLYLHDVVAEVYRVAADDMVKIECDVSNLLKKLDDSRTV